MSPVHGKGGGLGKARDAPGETGNSAVVALPPEVALLPVVVLPVTLPPEVVLPVAVPLAVVVPGVAPAAGVIP